MFQFVRRPHEMHTNHNEHFSDFLHMLEPRKTPLVVLSANSKCTHPQRGLGDEI